MTELSLDHDQRDAFAGHLYRVSVPELMGREPASNSGLEGSFPQLDADPGR